MTTQEAGSREPRAATVLLVDHFDSFVHNQARYMERMGITTHVVRCDAISVQAVHDLRPQAIWLSPGPCTPEETGATRDIVRTFLGHIPLLGVCLGHQTLAAVTGGRVIRAPRPQHGRASHIHHDQQLDFAGIPQDFLAARYHSLIVDGPTLPTCWQASAHTADGLLMAMRHRTAFAWGWQFHPESVLTEPGYALMANFFRQAGIALGPMPCHASEVSSMPPIPPASSPDPWSMPRSQSGLPLSF